MMRQIQVTGFEVDSRQVSYILQLTSATRSEAGKKKEEEEEMIISFPHAFVTLRHTKWTKKRREIGLNNCTKYINRADQNACERVNLGSTLIDTFITPISISRLVKSFFFSLLSEWKTTNK